MKLLYFSIEQLHSRPGIKKKLFGQINAFSQYNLEVHLLYLEKDKIILYNGQNKKEVVLQTFSSNVKLFLSYKEILLNQVNVLLPDVVYIRYWISEFYIIGALRKLKKKGIQTFIEIATYPYENEYKRTILKRIALQVDKYYRKKLKRYVSHIVTYTNHKNIYGLPAIKIENGIDFLSQAIQPKPAQKNELHLVAVANVSYWHGYDRVLEGLKHYYSKTTIERPVFFHVVGKGKELDNLQELTNNYRLNEYVTFYGEKYGPDLEEIIRMAHVGIDVLGMHRRGFNEAASLKAREYCTFGIPFVSSVYDNDFVGFRYVLKLKPDDNPAHVGDIIDFYESLAGIDYASEMIQYAKDHLTWKVKMKPVIERFGKN